MSKKAYVSKKDRKIVIVSGKQFSGKDTVSNTLMNILSDFKLAPLADAIKIEFSQQKKITFNEVERNKPLYREDLIEFSTKRREKDPDYWLKKVLSTEDNIIISDVRLQHEIKVFSEFDIIKIRVESDRTERAKRGRLVSENDFTEVDLDNYKDWDYIIKNNGTIEQLKEEATKIGNKILKTLPSPISSF